MLEALANVVQRGELETARGSFYALEELQERQRDEGDADWIKDYDFSSASYWWMPNEYEPGRAHSEPRPYQNVAAIFDAWFQ
jgi:hypothetical protein